MRETKTMEEMADAMETLFTMLGLIAGGSIITWVVLCIIVPYIILKVIDLSIVIIAASKVFLTIILSYIVRKLPDSEKQGENNETT